MGWSADISVLKKKKTPLLPLLPLLLPTSTATHHGLLVLPNTPICRHLSSCSCFSDFDIFFCLLFSCFFVNVLALKRETPKHFEHLSFVIFLFQFVKRNSTNKVLKCSSIQKFKCVWAPLPTQIFQLQKITKAKIKEIRNKEKMKEITTNKVTMFLFW